MIRFFLTIIFTIAYLSGLPQEIKSFEILLDSNNNFKADIDTVFKVDFPENSTSRRWIGSKITENIDSTYSCIRSKYPNSFSDSTSCVVLNGKTEKKTLCVDTSDFIDPKEWVSYNIFDCKKDFILYRIYYYEDEEYVLFNPKNRIIISGWKYPSFIEEKSNISVIDFEILAHFSSFELKS